MFMCMQLQLIWMWAYYWWEEQKAIPTFPALVLAKLPSVILELRKKAAVSAERPSRDCLMPALSWFGFCEEMNEPQRIKKTGKPRAEDERGESPTEEEATLLSHSIRYIVFTGTTTYFLFPGVR